MSYLFVDKSLTDIHNAIMEKQAQMFFQQEKHVLGKWFKKTKHDFISLGCGNGYYLTLLKKYFKHSTFLGVDINEQNIQSGLELLNKKNIKDIKLKQGDILKIKFDRSFDVLLLRLVCQHLGDNCIQLFKNCKSFMHPGSKIVVIDVDANLGSISMFPKRDSIIHLNEKMDSMVTSNNGDRTIGMKIIKYLGDLGFIKINAEIINFTNFNTPIEEICEVLMMIGKMMHMKDKSFYSANRLSQLFKECNDLKKKRDIFISFPLLLLSAESV